MSLSDARRARLLDALDDWRDGEKVYGDEAAKYAGAWWIDAGRPRKPCGFRWKSRPAWETLKRLRGAIARRVRRHRVPGCRRGWLRHRRATALAGRGRAAAPTPVGVGDLRLTRLTCRNTSAARISPRSSHIIVWPGYLLIPGTPRKPIGTLLDGASPVPALAGSSPPHPFVLPPQPHG